MDGQKKNPSKLAQFSIKMVSAAILNRTLLSQDIPLVVFLDSYFNRAQPSLFFDRSIYEFESANSYRLYIRTCNWKVRTRDAACYIWVRPFGYEHVGAGFLPTGWGLRGGETWSGEVGSSLYLLSRRELCIM